MHEIVEKMVSQKKDIRPNCSQILKEKKSWALDLQQLRKVAEIQLNELKPSDESFYSTFIQIKLKIEPKKEENFLSWIFG